MLVTLSVATYQTVTPVTATILYPSGHATRPALLEQLGREVIEASELVAEHLPPATPPTSPVTLVCITARLSSEQLASLVAWGNQMTPATGLIGYATAGNAADGEGALAAGFDDFVVGEVSIRELAARIRALFRRIQRAELRKSELHRFGDISLDPIQRQLWVGGNRVQLTKTELAVMRALIGARGRALHRRELLDAGWGDQNFEIGERAVDNVILRLRRKLGDNRTIVTVRGIGFRLASA